MLIMLKIKRPKISWEQECKERHKAEGLAYFIAQTLEEQRRRGN